MDCQKNKFVYFAVFSANLMTTLSSIGYAWTSPCLPKLNGNVDPENNPLSRPTTILEDSWIASLHNLGALFGPFFSSIAANKYGRKKTLILFSIPMLISNIILIFANTVEHFYVARFLVGLGTGCVFTVIPLYVAEISDVANRGFTSLVLALMMTSMQLIVYVIGPYITIRSLGVVAVIPSILFFICFGFFVPESPYYLVMSDNQEASKMSLAKLRQKTQSDVQKELLEVIRNVEETTANKVSLKELINSKVVMKCLVISFGLMFFQQFTGILAIIPYLQTIFDSTNTSISPEICVMMVGLVQLITVSITSRIIDKVGRKTLILGANVGVLIALGILGTYFYLQEIKYNLDTISWVPISSILFYIICFNVGIGPLPWTITGEIFPSNIKTYLSGLAATLNILCGFLISMFFPSLSQIIGMSWSIWFFGIWTFLSIFFIYYCVPETKGKSFSEIQYMLRGRNK